MNVKLLCLRKKSNCRLKEYLVTIYRYKNQVLEQVYLFESISKQFLSYTLVQKNIENKCHIVVLEKKKRLIFILKKIFTDNFFNQDSSVLSISSLID